MSSREPEAGIGRALAALIPGIAAGLAAGLALVALYLLLVSWAQGWAHARDLLWTDRYYVTAIATGFALQAGLFVHLRRLLNMRARASAGAGTAVGTSASTGAMLACCAHHVVDALPLLGLSGLAVFLVDFRLPLMLGGIGVNLAGVLFMLRLVWRQSRPRKAEGTCAVLS